MVSSTYIPSTIDEGAGAPAVPDDIEMVAALRRGDEDVFATLVEHYHGSMLRVALHYVSDTAHAEDVIQETWLGVLQGLDRFAGRSSLKTWIFHILTNIAITHGRRQRRTIPLSTLEPVADGTATPAVDPEHFTPEGHWRGMPQRWSDVPEARFLAAETREHIRAAIAALPPRLQQVIQLRDVEGWSAEETCAVFGISDGNQRVLLHRARAQVRRALECYLADTLTEDR
jgi:RNA polymerase sigma-70 factor (ECF subfamily)